MSLYFLCHIIGNQSDPLFAMQPWRCYVPIVAMATALIQNIYFLGHIIGSQSEPLFSMQPCRWIVPIVAMATALIQNLNYNQKHFLFASPFHSY